MKVVFEDSQLSFQALRMLSEVSAGQADVNEVIETARRIREGSFESWCEEWTKTADRVRRHAEEFLAQGHSLSAAETYLRASNYYRAAGFYRGILFVDGCGEEMKKKLNQLDDASLACFEQVIRYGNPPIEKVEIPYDNTSLPGHFYRVEKDFSSAPTLVMMTGYDGTKEEMYGCACAALKRGMNCLAFEGPGQGEVLRKRGLPFRPDWENVVSPALDFLIEDLGVCPGKIVLWGESMGGYLAPRAAAFDSRIAACVANSGVYDFIGSHAPNGMSREEFFGQVASAPEEAIQQIMSKEMAKHVQLNWAIKHGISVFQAKSVKDYLLKAKDYNLIGLASRIACPTLVIDTENEENFPGQAKKLYAELHCPKDYLLFTSADGAAEHCEEGAKLYANNCIFNWIEDTLKS